MSTPNFYAVCGRYFIVELNEEEWELQNLIVEDVENVIIEELGNKLYTVEEDKWDGERNYAGRIFGSIRKYFKVFDKELRDYVDLEVYINLICRSGYFCGYNLDYSVDIYYDGSSDVNYNLLSKTNAKKLNSFVRKATKAVEKVYRKYTTEYYCRGVFSNGEAIYEKA